MGFVQRNPLRDLLRCAEQMRRKILQLCSVNKSNTIQSFVLGSEYNFVNLIFEDDTYKN